MSRVLSVDLRVRADATRREVAERFGVSAASVSRWLEREQGDVRPKALGGDRRSGRIDADKAAILDALGRTPIARSRRSGRC